MPDVEILIFVVAACDDTGNVVPQIIITISNQNAGTVNFRETVDVLVDIICPPLQYISIKIVQDNKGKIKSKTGKPYRFPERNYEMGSEEATTSVCIS